MLIPSATYLNQNVVFTLNGGPVLRLLVKRLRIFGEYFVFECEPGQDPVWKNIRGGVQNVKTSNLQFV